MALASWDDIETIDDPAPPRASFADILTIEPPAAANVARFDDIASIDLPLSIAPTPEEQAIVDASPATRSLQKPTVESLFKLPQTVTPPLPASPYAPAAGGGGRGTQFDPRRAAAQTHAGLGAVSGVFQAPAGALQSLPAAASELATGVTPPGHENEPDTFFGRAAAHLGMTARGQGAAVSPQINPMNPPDSTVVPTAADIAIADKFGLERPQPRARGHLEQVGLELVNRGVGMAIKMLQDPAMVAFGLVRGAAAEALAVANSAIGVDAAVQTATNPEATDVDVAESVINAALMAVPSAMHLARRPGAHATDAAVTARPEPAPTSAPIVEPEVPAHVAHVSDIVSIEPPPAAAVAPAPVVKPTIDSLLDRVIDKYANREPLGSADAQAALAERQRVESVREAARAARGQTAPIADIVEVHEPAAVDVLDTGEHQARLPGDAGAVRDVETTTPAFEAPFSLTPEAAERKTVQPGLLDATIEEPHVREPAAAREIAPGGADERAATAAGGEDTPGGADVGPRSRRDREAADEQAILDELVADARTGGYTGDDAVLRGELDDRLQLLKELDAEFESSGHNPTTLLQEIAKRGGLGDDAGYQGELNWLKQHNVAPGTHDTSTRTFGRLGGVNGVFRKDGLTLDYMLEHLRQDVRFRHLETIDDLIDEVRAATMAERPGAAAHRLRKGLGEKWWETIDAGDVEFTPDDEAPTLDMPSRKFAGAWERPPRLPAKLRDEVPPKPKPTQEPRVPERTLLDQAESDEVLSRPLGSKRGDASGALVPSPASRALATVTREKQLRPSEIVKFISQSLDDLPVRVGVGKMRALGFWKPKWETIHLKVANDLDTFAHEIGHHVHETVVGGRMRYDLYRDELLRLGEPTSRSSYTIKQRLQEGEAEFTRYYLSDPAQAEKLAPRYFAAFEESLEQLPALQTVLQRAQRQYVGHLNADPVTRGMARIDFDGVQGGPKGDVVTRLETAWVDDLAPLRHAVDMMRDGEPIDALENGYTLARLARGAAAKADGFLRHGVRSSDGTFLAGALEPALKPVQKQMKEFAAYLVASRVPELKARGMETAMSAGEATAIRAKFQSPEFDAARQAVYDYQDGLLRYAKRSGMLSGKQIAAMKALNRAYVPFQRVMDDIGATAENGTRSGQNQRAPVKRIKGSGRDIINPIESIVTNTHTFVALVEENRARRALVDQARATKGAGRFFEPATEKQIATTFNLKHLAKQIREQLEAAGVDVPDNLDFDEVVTIFTPTQFKLGEKGIISVIRNGEREWYNVNEPALYDAITAVVPKQSDLLVNLFMRPARMLRAGATTTLGFIARNPIRDTLEATVNSRYGFRPGVDTLKGLFGYLKKDDDYQRFLNAGGGSAAMVAGDRNRVREAVRSMNLQAKRRIVDSVVFHPIDVLRALSEAMEQATRLGEFKRGYAHEQARGAGPGEAAARAALAGRDVTIDFARGGSVAKEINKYVAFLNANVQGKARIAEVFGRDPVGATLRATAAITLPSITLWALNHDDPEYHELPEWERNTYWHIPLGRGTGHTWARIPKPFDLGHLFGNMAEAALDFIKKEDAHAVARVFPDKDTAWKQLLALVPTALMPVVESATNYDTFRDRAIVSPYDLDLDTELQYNRWTSELAKAVGPKMGLAPAKLDHLIYGYGAGLARGVVQGVDPVFGGKSRPSSGAAGAPGLGAFYRDAPRNDAESLQRFYRLRDEIAGATGSVKRYEEAGDRARADARRQKARTELGADIGTVVGRVHAADGLLKQLRDQVNAVFASPTLSATDKRTRLDTLYLQMLDVARAGLGKQPLPKIPPPKPSLEKPAAATP